MPGGPGSQNLPTLARHMRRSYCDSLALDAEHVSDDCQVKWLTSAFEGDFMGDEVNCSDVHSTTGVGIGFQKNGEVSTGGWIVKGNGLRQSEILSELVRADAFERFLALKFPASKVNHSTLPSLLCTLCMCFCAIID